MNEVHPHLLQAPVSLDLGPNGPQGQAFGSLATEGPAELGAARASLPDPHLTSSLPCASVSVHLGAACGAAPPLCAPTTPRVLAAAHWLPMAPGGVRFINLVAASLKSFYCGEEIVKNPFTCKAGLGSFFATLTEINLFSIGDIPSLVLIHFPAHLIFLFIMSLMKIN